MFHTKKLQQLQQELESEYFFYRSGSISEKEYLERARPIDKAITELEMSTLQDTLALKGSSLLLSRKQES